MPRRPCNDIDRQLAENIRRERERKGMTQAALAAAIGISFQQLQKYEQARNRIAASRLLEIADVLAVPPEHLWRRAATQMEG